MTREIIKTEIEILNTPKHGISNPYVVARVDRYDGVLAYWYYGSYRDKEMAEDAASSLGNGIVLWNKTE